MNELLCQRGDAGLEGQGSSKEGLQRIRDPFEGDSLMYINDADRLEQAMGQFQSWCGKLFYYHNERLGWRYIK